MCVCGTKLRTARPTQNYESTDGEGDVELLVGWDPVWRFSAQKQALSAASPVFEALFQGPLATSDKRVEIPDVDPRAFDYLLMYFDGKDVKLQSVAVALNTLYAAQKYLVSGLAQICIDYLIGCFAVDSVLDVFQHARRYAGRLNPNDSPGHERKYYTPTAPTSPLLDAAEDRLDNELVRWSEVLLTKCLEFVDVYAKEVFRLENVEDLEVEALGELLRRDSLNCDELEVWAALDRWSEKECRRKQLSPNPENRREVLGDLIYQVRLITLTSDEFIGGPLQSQLFSQEEVQYLLAVIAGTGMPSVPQHLQPHVKRMQRRRCPVLPISKAANMKRSESRGKSWLKQSKDKPSKTTTKKSNKSDKEKGCSGSCITDYMVDVLACIFD